MILLASEGRPSCWLKHFYLLTSNSSRQIKKSNNYCYAPFTKTKTQSCSSLFSQKKNWHSMFDINFLIWCIVLCLFSCEGIWLMKFENKNQNWFLLAIIESNLKYHKKFIYFVDGFYKSCQLTRVIDVNLVVLDVNLVISYFDIKLIIGQWKQ